MEWEGRSSRAGGAWGLKVGQLADTPRRGLAKGPPSPGKQQEAVPSRPGAAALSHEERSPGGRRGSERLSSVGLGVVQGAPGAGSDGLVPRDGPLALEVPGSWGRSWLDAPAALPQQGLTCPTFLGS